MAAFAWVMVLTGVGFRDYTSHSLIGTSFLDRIWKPSTFAALVGYGGLALLLVRQLARRSNARLSPQPAS